MTGTRTSGVHDRHDQLDRRQPDADRLGTSYNRYGLVGHTASGMSNSTATHSKRYVFHKKSTQERFSISSQPQTVPTHPKKKLGTHASE